MDFPHIDTEELRRYLQNLDSNQIKNVNSVKSNRSLISSGLSNGMGNPLTNISITDVLKIEQIGENGNVAHLSTSSNVDLFKIELKPIQKYDHEYVPQKLTINMLNDKKAAREKATEEVSYCSCSVCFEDFDCSGQNSLKVPVILECFHTFCKHCVFQIFRRPDAKCPNCRHILDKKRKLQTNFYIEEFLKSKRRKVVKDLTVWCKECQTVANEGCTTHESQEMTDAVSELWNTNNHIWNSLTEIIAHLSESSKLSYEASWSASKNINNSVVAFLDVVRNSGCMLKELVISKRNISSQMEEIQSEFKLVEPLIKKFNSIVSRNGATSTAGGEGSGSFSGNSSTLDEQNLSDHEKRIKILKLISHSEKVGLAKEIRAVINVLNNIEKNSNIVVKKRDAQNLALTTIKTKQIERLLGDKMQDVMKSVQKTFEDFDPVL